MTALKLVMWSLAVMVFGAFVKQSRAFVNPRLLQPLTQLTGSRSRSNQNPSGDGVSRSTWLEPSGVIAKTMFLGELSLRRNCGHRVGSRCRRSGVCGLQAALDLPPMTTADIVQFVGRQLQEQSAKHHWQSGVIGGSVGVVGTLTAIQLKVNQVRELTSCPYCRSKGQLACATCFGVGSVSIMDTMGSTGQISTTTLTCPACRGKTYITCVNCKGDGRGVPLFLNKKVSRDPESEIEDVGYA